MQLARNSYCISHASGQKHRRPPSLILREYSFKRVQPIPLTEVTRCDVLQTPLPEQPKASSHLQARAERRISRKKWQAIRNVGPKHQTIWLLAVRWEHHIEEQHLDWRDASQEWNELNNWLLCTTVVIRNAIKQVCFKLPPAKAIKSKQKVRAKLKVKPEGKMD